MKLVTILIIGGVMFVIALAINIFAFVLEKKYKNKMNDYADKK